MEWLRVITQIPRRSENNDTLVWPSILDCGSSSWSDIYIIIPETNEKQMASIISFINGFKNRKAINAPKGSAKADKKV